VIYRACVLGGVSAGILVSALFASRAGLTPSLWIAVAAFGVAIALFFAAITKVLFGKETFSFLHYQLMALASTSALLAAMGAPILPALDLLALTLAMAQGFGRIGCATAGCCHGRPFRIGIRYDRERVAEHWSGARLFPVQWIESLVLFGIAIAVGLTIGDEPGSAFALYATSYAAARFMLEILRGDRRRHLLQLSEAQWICLATAIGITAWQRGFGILIAALLALGALVLHRANRIDFDAFARAVHAARSTSSVATMSAVRISHGKVDLAEHYTISADRPLTPRAAGWLAGLLRDTAHPDQSIVLRPAQRSGIYHVVVGGTS
jgi:prolipoprotein diacylglyceryltransferase